MEEFGKGMGYRAQTPEQKKAFFERLLRAWEKVPMLRFPQLLIAAAKTPDIFYIEDYVLLELVEHFVAMIEGEK